MENKINKIKKRETKKKFKNFIYIIAGLIFIFIINFSFVSAEIVITKTASSEINFGDILDVTIKIENQGPQINVLVKEYIGNAEVIMPLDKLIIPQTVQGKIALEPSYLSWNLTLDQSSSISLNYKIKPNFVGYYSFAPTNVITSEGIFYSNTLNVKVLAVQDGKCNPSIGENYFNSKDCDSGSRDSVCDALMDNKCDPDCVQGADFDCSYASQESRITGKTIHLEARVYPLWQKILFFGLIAILIITLILIFSLRVKKRKEKNFIAPPTLIKKPILPPNYNDNSSNSKNFLPPPPPK